MHCFDIYKVRRKGSKCYYATMKETRCGGVGCWGWGVGGGALQGWGECPQTLGGRRGCHRVLVAMHINEVGMSTHSRMQNAHWENNVVFSFQMHYAHAAPWTWEALPAATTDHHQRAVRGELEFLKQTDDDSDEVINHQAGFSAWAGTAEIGNNTATITRVESGGGGGGGHANGVSIIPFLFAFCPSGS